MTITVPHNWKNASPAGVVTFYRQPSGVASSPVTARIVGGQISTALISSGSVNELSSYVAVFSGLHIGGRSHLGGIADVSLRVIDLPTFTPSEFSGPNASLLR